MYRVWLLPSSFVMQCVSGSAGRFGGVRNWLGSNRQQRRRLQGPIDIVVGPAPVSNPQMGPKVEKFNGHPPAGRSACQAALSSLSNICIGWPGMMVEIACL
jgi:hypothetical protein